MFAAATAFLWVRLKHAQELDAQIIHAANSNDAAGVSRLLAAGANPNAEDEIWLGGPQPLSDRLNIIGARLVGNRYYQNRTALMIATSLDNKAMVQNLLTHGAKVDRESEMGMTPLMAAIDSRDLSLVKLLIAHGAGVNHEDDGGRTPIFYVLYTSNGGRTIPVGMAQTLVAAGANINARDRGHRTVLDLAKGRQRADVVALFQSLGAK